jgi:hypothetical protein
MILPGTWRPVDTSGEPLYHVDEEPRVSAKKKFAYYGSLSPRQMRIYDRSDEISHIPLPRTDRLPSLLEDVRTSLERDSLARTREAVQHLVSELCGIFGLPPIQVIVLSCRPRGYRGFRGEMHGLYEMGAGEPTTLTVWMRTAKRKQAVAFRTFLRTVIHEFLHHMDFVHYGFSDSFHTNGFFMRESSLLKQMLGE